MSINTKDPVLDYYFSPQNVILLQDRIKKLVKKAVNIQLTEDQDPISMQSAMHTVYVDSYSMLPSDPKIRLAVLDEEFLKAVVPKIISNALLEIEHRRTLFAPPKPTLPMPYFDSKKGLKLSEI